MNQGKHQSSTDSSGMACRVGSLLACPALLALVLFGAVGCGSNSGFKINNIDIGKGLSTLGHAKDALTQVSEPEEIALGQGIAANLLGSAPLLADAKVQNYVNKVGRWVSLHSERPDLPWTFAVLDDASTNAFAAPGGYIVITRGLLGKLNSEAELAGVLGHEIAHVLRRHHLLALQKSSGMSALKDGLSFVLTAKDQDTRFVKVVDAGTELYTRGLDKEDEFESDSMGAVLAARAGYDPYALASVLQTLQRQGKDDAGMAMLFRTHPSMADRLQRLEAAMSESFERLPPLPAIEDRFQHQLKGVARTGP
jgi:beta-barrel assembly-enhancing protease